MADTEVIYFCGGNDKPPPIGDPVYSSIQLFAARVREGIRASWFIGADIPWGVAYVTLYRSTGSTWSDNFTPLWSGGANQYLDNVNDLEIDTTYYYWIIVTSVNGTDSIRVGPESATMRPWLNQTLEDLKNSITESSLNQDLQDKITSISSFQSGLDLLDDKYAGINAASAAAMDLFRIQLEAEGVARIEGYNFLKTETSNAVYLIDGIGATFNSSFAAILTEQAVYADNTSALATEVTRIEASIPDPYDDTELSAKVQINATATADLEKGVSANYTVKVEANNKYGGVVAGFGLAVTDEEDPNLAPMSTFIVRADRFALLPATNGFGTSDPNEKNGSVPFVVANGETYIESAFIQKASIDTLKIAGNSVVVGVISEMKDQQIQAGNPISPVPPTSSNSYAAQSLQANMAYPQNGILSAFFIGNIILPQSKSNYSLRFYIDMVDFGTGRYIGHQQTVTKIDTRVEGNDAFGLSIPICIQSSVNTKYQPSDAGVFVNVRVQGPAGIYIENCLLTLQVFKR